MEKKKGRGGKERWFIKTRVWVALSEIKGEAHESIGSKRVVRGGKVAKGKC